MADAGLNLVKNKVALITGIRGQDGAFLAQQLLEKGYKVVGADRRSGGSDTWRLQELGIADQVEIKYMDLLEHENILTVMGDTDPDLVFNLAAQSFVGVSFDQPLLTNEVNGLGVLRLLTVVRSLQLVREMTGADIRFYQASTSEMFGDTPEPADETTPFHPKSPYGVAKAHAHWATQLYRETYKLFACSGILFNHESELRGEEFVTRKISKAVARIYHGKQDYVELGNLDARRDWGHARDYVDAMIRMLEHNQPDDYVIGTGTARTIREFCEAAFAVIKQKLEWAGEGTAEVGSADGKMRVQVNQQFYRPQDVDVLIAKPDKAKAVLDWEPQITFEDMVTTMVEADIRREEK